MNRVDVFVFAILLLLLMPGEASPGSLHGTVRNSESLLPIEGVDVTVHVVIPDSIPYPTTTDQNGEYSITGIVPNNEVYAVVTYKGGYVYTYARIDDLGSLDLEYDIFLRPEITGPGGGDSTLISGQIMRPTISGGDLVPLPHAVIRLFSSSREINLESDSNGSYTSRIHLGSYSVSVSAQGYQTLQLGAVSVDAKGVKIDAVLQSEAVGVQPGDADQGRGSFELLRLYPNPFNPTTNVEFRCPEEATISIVVYDVLGREVAVLTRGDDWPAGIHTAVFDASSLPGGMYLIRIEATPRAGHVIFARTQRALLLK